LNYFLYFKVKVVFSVVQFSFSILITKKKEKEKHFCVLN